MPIDVTLEYSEGVVRGAALATWRRALGVRFIAALGLVSASLLILLFEGDRSWFVGMLATVLVLGIAFAVMGYLLPLRSSLGRLHRMQRPQARFQGDSTQFTITSELGTIGLPWTAVRRVWRYPSFWLLVLSRSSQVTVPLFGVGPEAQAFMLERIQSAGGKIGG